MQQTQLEQKLKLHQLEYNPDNERHYQDAQIMARHYAKYENAMVVVSNLVSDRSFICLGPLSHAIGLEGDKAGFEVDGIWEKNILDCIHPDDVIEKYAWELRFLTFLETIPMNEKRNYILQHIVRFDRRDGRNTAGSFIYLRHRVLYLDYDADGHALLAMCLYNATASDAQFSTGIINTLTGTLIPFDVDNMTHLLSKREREILRLIGAGLSSKMIAERLCISTHTVNGHRQNLLQKLHVSNSSEALAVARKLGIV